MDSKSHKNLTQGFLDGKPSKSDAVEKLLIASPTTGKPLFEITKGAISDSKRAVDSARIAFSDGRWSDAQPSFRKKVMLKWAELVESSADYLDRLDAEEMGKPVSLQYCNAAAAASLIRFQAELIDKINGTLLPSDAYSMAVQRFVPRGVVAAIVPWNFPLFCAVLKVSPALTAGNSVVLKPSELSSRSAVMLAQLATEAGIPDGVFNVVLGSGAIVGQSLASSKEVDMVTFTGSTAVGKKILQLAGESNLKHVMAECGGKSPQLVFNDGVNLDEAAKYIAQLIMTNQGQLCSTGSRLLVDRDIQDLLIEKIQAEMQKAVIGDPVEAKTTFGPVVSAGQCKKIEAIIDNAKGTSAVCVTGGKRISEMAEGFYIAPTIYKNVDPGSELAQKEIFGPILAVTSFNSIDEAIQLANSTKYGLVAYAWTASIDTAMQVAKGINSSVLVNSTMPKGEGPGHAFSLEPYGESGTGVEGGLSGLENYLYRQTVQFNHS